MENSVFSSASDYYSVKPGLTERVLLVLMGYQNLFFRSALNFFRRLQLNYQKYDKSDLRSTNTSHFAVFATCFWGYMFSRVYEYR